MERQVILGFAGRAGSGKTTACQFVSRYFDFREVNFADPLKAAARHLFGFTEEQLTTAGGKAALDPHWGMTPRKAMQILGTEAMRGTFGEMFWVDRLAKDLQSTGRVVIGDVRFPNEADWIRGRGGKIVLIERPGTERIEHLSETALDDYRFDLVVENDGSPAEFRGAIHEAVKELFYGGT